MSEAIFNVNMDRIRHLRDLKESDELFVLIPKNCRLNVFGGKALTLDENGNLVNSLYNAVIFKSYDIAECFVMSDLYKGTEDVVITRIYGDHLENEVSLLMDSNIKEMDFIKYNMTTDEIEYGNN